MGPDLAAALRATAIGCALALEVSPGASAARFPDGINAWRGRIRCRVRAPPKGGQANREVCAVVAACLGVPPGAVQVTTGHTSTQKTVHVAGRTPAEVLAAFREAVP